MKDSPMTEEIKAVYVKFRKTYGKLPKKIITSLSKWETYQDELVPQMRRVTSKLETPHYLFETAGVPVVWDEKVTKTKGVSNDPD